MGEDRFALIQRGQPQRPADRILEGGIQFPEVMIFDGIIKNVPFQIAEQRRIMTPQILINVQTGFGVLRERFLGRVAFSVNIFFPNSSY